MRGTTLESVVEKLQNATDSIAAYAIFYWPVGLNDTETSRIETVTTYTNGVPSGTVRNVYNDDDTLFSSTPVAPSATNNLTHSSATEALNALNALNAFIGAVRGGKPVPLVTSGFNLVYTLGGHPANLQGANKVISGLGSVYGLHTAFQGGGSGVLLNTTDSIAAYAIFYWTRGLNSNKNRAANDLHWKAAA